MSQPTSFWKSFAAMAIAAVSLAPAGQAATSFVYVPAAPNVLASKLPKDTVLRLRTNVTLNAGAKNTNIYAYHDLSTPGTLLGRSTIDTNCWFYHDEVIYQRLLPAGTDLLFTSMAQAVPGSQAERQFSYVQANVVVRNGTFANLPLKLVCQVTAYLMYADENIDLKQVHASRITDTNELACFADVYTLAPQGTQQSPLACRPTPQLGIFDWGSASYLPGVSESPFWLQLGDDDNVVLWTDVKS